MVNVINFILRNFSFFVKKQAFFGKIVDDRIVTSGIFMAKFLCVCVFWKWQNFYQLKTTHFCSSHFVQLFTEAWCQWLLFAWCGRKESEFLGHAKRLLADYSTRAKLRLTCCTAAAAAGAVSAIVASKITPPYYCGIASNTWKMPTALLTPLIANDISKRDLWKQKWN